jgi:ParB-like chromosome segregation protein Spo0J
MLSQKIEMLPVSALRPYERNARTHSTTKIKQLARSIERFGFLGVVMIDDNMTVLAGHARLEAAKLLKLTSVPAVRVSHLNEQEKRAYLLADNKLATKGGWNREMLAAELTLLAREDFAMDIIGFAPKEVEGLLAKREFHERNLSRELPTLR